MIPVGEHMANLRRKGGLGKDPKRAEKHAKQLAPIDPDWNYPWPLDWQRHYRVLADLVDADGSLPAIETRSADGRRRHRAVAPAAGPAGHLGAAVDEQQERLSKLGVQPDQAPAPTPAATRATKGPNKAQQAFQRPSHNGSRGKA